MQLARGVRDDVGAATQPCECSPRMGQSLFFHLFGVGKMPEPIRSQVVAEKPLVFTEGVRGWLRPRGRLPHGIIAYGIRSQHGGFAITDDRIVMTASKHVVVDLRFADAADSGCAEIEVTEAFD
jgi:hypothetical protein